MSQMPDDYDDEDNEVVNCYTAKEFREAVEKTPDDTLIYLRGEGKFGVPDVDRIPQHVTVAEGATLQGGHPDLHLNVHCDAVTFIDQAKYVWTCSRGVCDIHNADSVCAVDGAYLFAWDCGVVHAGDTSQVSVFDCETVVVLDRAQVALSGKCYCFAFERSDVDAGSNAYCTIEAHDFSRVIAESSSRIAYRGPGATVITPYGDGDTVPFIGDGVEDWARTYGAHIDQKKDLMYVYKCVGRNLETGELETGRLRGRPTRWEAGKRTKCVDWDPSPLSRHGLSFASHPVRAAMMIPRGGEGHMLRCAIPANAAVIMGGGNSVKAPWADVVEEVEFDWRQVP